MFEVINKLSVKAYSGCNLNCCYCHQLPEYKYHAGIFEDFDNLEKLLMELPFADIVDVTITGGEITLRPDCFMNVAKVFKKVERKNKQYNGI